MILYKSNIIYNVHILAMPLLALVITIVVVY